MTKHFSISAAVLTAAIFGSTNPAYSDKYAVKAAPVHFFACNYRDGKSMDDLEKVNESYRAFAAEHQLKYAAWMLVPQFRNQLDYDVGWLGAWQNSNDFGVTMEHWMEEGREMAAAYEAVVDCSSRHELALWVPVTAAQSTPEDGVLMISRCSLREGKANEDALKAHTEFGNYMRGLGSMASSWLFYPVMGAGNIDYDYYHAVAFYRYSDLGAALELYANGGGYQKEGPTVGKVADCRAPNVFDVISVRAFEE